MPTAFTIVFVGLTIFLSHSYNFFGSCLVAGSIAYFYTDLGVLRSLMLGSIVGGTSSAVVTTLARQYHSFFHRIYYDFNVFGRQNMDIKRL